MNSYQINPYVNGALYSLLGNKEINIVAQDMGIENKIIEKCQVRFKKSQQSTKYFFKYIRTVRRKQRSNWSTSWTSSGPPTLARKAA